MGSAVVAGRARLDHSRRDDQRRVRTRQGVWVQGILSRLANSRFMECDRHRRQPSHHSTTDFTAPDGRHILLTLTTRRPNLHSSLCIRPEENHRTGKPACVPFRCIYALAPFGRLAQW